MKNLKNLNEHDAFSHDCNIMNYWKKNSALTMKKRYSTSILILLNFQTKHSAEMSGCSVKFYFNEFYF